ncbi:MAG: DUF192 domain-containing protein [Myxococcota bacterium]
MKRLASRAGRTRVARLVPILLAALLALVACRDGASARDAGAARAGTSASHASAIEGEVEIRAKKVPVEIADSPAEQQKGLGERDRLAWGTGMYFPYAKPAFVAFWMKGMRFPIDIVFLRDGRIVEIHPQVPFEPGGNGPTIRPRSLADAVLEVPAGYAGASGWQVGDRVRFARISAD